MSVHTKKDATVREYIKILNLFFHYFSVISIINVEKWA